MVRDERRPAVGGASLPSSRSFVVQFAADTATKSHRFRGRVEHIESSRSRRFDSVTELVDFLNEVLEEDDGRDSE